MDIYVCDRQQRVIAIIDTFESFIWSDRYGDCGDFELYMMPLPDMSMFQIDNYIQIKGSESMMIIEDIQVDVDVETGPHYTITGRSLESILYRRVIWNNTTLEGDFQTGIEKLLNRNIISPTDSDRRISNFVFRSSNDAYIAALEIDAFYCGENLYDVIYSLCLENDIAFRIIPDNSGGFIFELYRGTDRSFNQESVPWVIFSPDYDNILSSSYYTSKRDYTTGAVVKGEQEEWGRRVISVDDTGSTGIDRREVYVDAGQIPLNSDTGVPIGDAYYTKILEQKGRDALADLASSIIESFNGDIDAKRQFVYGEDFFLGDIVQIVNEYGIEAATKVSEVVLSYSAEGEFVTPTFTSVNPDSDD